MSRDLELLVTKDDLLLTKSPLSAEQMQLFYQRTPEEKIKQRAAKGGGTWEYVQTSYAIDTLNRLNMKTYIDITLRRADTGHLRIPFGCVIWDRCIEVNCTVLILAHLYTIDRI